MEQSPELCSEGLNSREGGEKMDKMSAPVWRIGIEQNAQDGREVWLDSLSEYAVLCGDRRILVR